MKYIEKTTFGFGDKSKIVTINLVFGSLCLWLFDTFTHSSSTVPDILNRALSFSTPTSADYSIGFVNRTLGYILSFSFASISGLAFIFKIYDRKKNSKYKVLRGTVLSILLSIWVMFIGISTYHSVDLFLSQPVSWRAFYRGGVIGVLGVMFGYVFSIPITVVNIFLFSCYCDKKITTHT